VNALIARMEQLEARFERLRIQFLQAQADIARALQQIRDLQTGGGGGSSVQTPLYWATNSGSVSAASGTTLPGLTPTTFTSSIYTNVSGTLTLQATSQTVYWWYLDSLPANSIVPVEPSNSGTTWDAIANGCTAL
jgi:hypothetical protein